MSTHEWIDVIRVTGVVLRHQGRHCYAVVCENDVVYAAVGLDDNATTPDAQMGVLSTLGRHPELVGVPIDFITNDRKLASMIKSERQLFPNVEPIDSSLLAVGFTGLQRAETAAVSAATARGPIPILAATDGAKAKHHPRGGYGWVTTDGRFGHGPIEPTSVVESELVAIGKLLDSIEGDQPLHVLVDSDHARKLATAALAGKLTEKGIVRNTGDAYGKIARHRGRDVTFLNVAGHSGEPLNTCADTLAVGARRGAEENYSEDIITGKAEDAVRQMREKLALVA